MSIFDIQPHVAQPTLEGKAFLFYGERKIGKTTIATQFPKPFIVGFEKGWGALNNIFALSIKDWGHFKKEVVKPLLKDAEEVEKGKKEETHYKTIIVDTADIAYNMADSYVCSREGITHLDESENKRGYKMTKKEFEDNMFALLKAGYTVIFISHAEWKKVKNPITREDDEKVIPTMNKNAYAILGGVVDLIAYFALVETESGAKRAIYFRSNGGFEAGGRWSEFLPGAIEMNFKKLETSIIDAVIKQAEVDGVDLNNTAPKQNLYSTEEAEYDYEELMEKVTALGKALNKADRLEIINDLAEENFGVGAKLSQCTKLQVETLHFVIASVEEAMEKEGIDLPY